MKISELDYLSNTTNTTVIIGVDQDSVPNKVVKIPWKTEVAAAANVAFSLAYGLINVVTITSNTTLNSTLHQGNMLVFNNTNTIQLTVNTTNEFGLYKQCEILAEKGVVRVSNGAGVIINRASGLSNTIMLYGRAVLLHTSNSNTYILTGELEEQF